jgi:hypothetical protein
MFKGVSMRRLPIAIIAAVMLCAAAAQAAFVNGVERFDGTILDTNTWTGAPTDSIASQNNSLTIGGSSTSTSYTAHSFTLGVGQGVRATVTTPNPFAGPTTNLLLLADRSAGFSVPVIFHDQNYVGLGVSWEAQTYFHNFPPVGPGSVYGLRGNTNISSGVATLIHWENVPGVPQLIVEMDRLDQTVFRFSAWYAQSNALLGTTVADVFKPAEDLPSNLYVVLAGTGTWDDVTIVSVPEGGTAGLVLGLGLTITRQRRIRPEVC